MRKGGTNWPPADMQQTAVAKIPLSRSQCANLFFPPLTEDSCGLCTVVTPVSSTLKILCGGKKWFACTEDKMSKNLSMFVWLKHLALAAEVDSGVRIASSGWRTWNPNNQSLPASPTW